MAIYTWLIGGEEGIFTSILSDERVTQAYCNYSKKTLILNLVPTTHFWNDLHQVHTKSKDSTD